MMLGGYEGESVSIDRQLNWGKSRWRRAGEVMIKAVRIPLAIIVAILIFASRVLELFAAILAVFLGTRLIDRVTEYVGDPFGMNSDENEDYG